MWNDCPKRPTTCRFGEPGKGNDPRTWAWRMTYCDERPLCYYQCIQIECTGAIVANMSIRGLDDQSLARLKRQAAQEGGSLNSLVVRLLQGTGETSNGAALQKFDDLDALAGAWSEQEARGFERNSAEFSEVDVTLWK